VQTFGNIQDPSDREIFAHLHTIQLILYKNKFDEWDIIKGGKLCSNTDEKNFFRICAKMTFLGVSLCEKSITRILEA
jgi:hypothetical protein